jgi:hypothetical protein
MSGPEWILRWPRIVAEEVSLGTKRTPLTAKRALGGYYGELMRSFLKTE